MVRPLRIEFPGAVYHVTARGNARTKIFEDDADRGELLCVLKPHFLGPDQRNAQIWRDKAVISRLY